jgi:chromate reductase
VATKILIGSLRKDSLNLLLAKEAKNIFESLGEEDVEIVIPDLPLFNQDLENKGFEPHDAAARLFREKMREANRLLVCAPEYDRLPSAIILNACHWVSRPPDRPLAETPVMLSGVSSGKGATRSARPTLQTAFTRIDARVIPEEIFVPEGKELLLDETRMEALRFDLKEKLPFLLRERKERD